MKKNLKTVAVMASIALFAAMSLGSGSTSSGETKEIVTNESEITKSETTSETNTSSEKENTEASSVITIEEQVLVEENGLKITAKEYVTDSIWGEGIKLLLENDGSTDLTVGCDALIVNDYMISDLFATEVAAGKKANETVYLSSSELKAAGIDNVGKVEIYFHASDAATYTSVFSNVKAEIHTSEYENMDVKANDEGTELYNEGGIRIIGKTVDENSFWGTAILLYIENNTDKKVGISVDDMSVNGFMMSPFFTTTVYSEKKDIDDITIFSSDLEENDISSIDEVELKFHIYDSDSYNTIKDTEPITFSAK